MGTRNEIKISSRKENMASESLDEFDYEVDGFMERDIIAGKSIATFNFGTSAESSIMFYPSLISNYIASNN